MAGSRSHWDLPWKRRPVEEAINLNPAFCGELILRTVREYGKALKAPMSVSLSFLVLPIVLHKGTRDELPGKADTAFVGWVAEHGPLLAGLPDRVVRLSPISREALMLMLQHGLLALENGGLVTEAKRLKSSAIADRSTDDTNEARGAAELLGRWFARQAQAAHVMQALGVKP
jgi:hypothetical protein